MKKWRFMARHVEVGQTENAPNRREVRSALRATGPIGDVIQNKSVTDLIQFD